MRFWDRPIVPNAELRELLVASIPTYPDFDLIKDTNLEHNRKYWRSDKNKSRNADAVVIRKTGDEAKTSFFKVMTPDKLSIICEHVGSKLNTFENNITSSSLFACLQKMVMLPMSQDEKVLSDRLKDLEEEVKNCSLKDAIEKALADSENRLKPPFDALDEP